MCNRGLEIIAYLNKTLELIYDERTARIIDGRRGKTFDDWYERINDLRFEISAVLGEPYNSQAVGYLED